MVYDKQVVREDDSAPRLFAEALLSDLGALAEMLERGMLEEPVHRIGAEQEMFLVGPDMRPAPVAMELLEDARHPSLTTEMGRFNLEANLSPREFTGACLRQMEQELEGCLAAARAAARRNNADVLVVGILPTLQKTDLTLENLTPKARYHELNRIMSRLRGETYHVLIKGIDELQMTHDNVMLESCCSSFQTHYQVTGREFPRLYNIAQIATAPVLAAAVNSPLLLGYRLWQETRVPLFQHSVDERSSASMLRGHPSRVSFGNGWVRESVLEIFREQVVRFPIIMTAETGTDSREMLARGLTPDLVALRLHNGTVWRWNRPCYGVTNGVPHLRIEARALPAGPSVLDEMANAAFLFGLTSALPDEYGRFDDSFPFEDATNNFFAAARHGLNAQFNWLNGKRHTAASLILEHLLPLARAGLKSAGIDSTDTDRYLGTIQERVEADQTGSQWSLRSLNAIHGHGTGEVRNRVLTACMLERQLGGEPVHKWPLADFSVAAERIAADDIVAEIMSTDLFTVLPGDPIHLAASMMDWKHIRHVPVEDENGHLAGLVSHRDILRLVAEAGTSRAAQPVLVRDIMNQSPLTVDPKTLIIEALRLMREKNVDCLPVLEGQSLVGILTTHDLLNVLARMLERGSGGVTHA